MAFALPWCPLNELENAYGLIQREVNLLAYSPSLYEYCQVFLQYLNEQWLNNRDLPREEWNFFGDDEISNNNMCEVNT